MASLNAKISLYTEAVVFDEATKEVLACIPLKQDGDAILKKGISFRLYEKGTEPTFKNIDGVLMLNESATVFKNLF